MKCFYHNDADGRCAAHLIANRLEYVYQEERPEGFIEMDYTTMFPLEIIDKNEEVYILDYSIYPEEMRELLKITPNVTWIDHHKTAIDRYKDFEHDIRGVRVDGVSACMLTNCYLYWMTRLGEGEIKPFDYTKTKFAPMFVKLIDDWDIWKFEFGDDTRYFINALNTYNPHPTSAKWLEVAYLWKEKYVKEGRIMTLFQDNWAKEYMSFGYETYLKNYKCFVANLGKCNSEYFKSIPNHNNYDILISYVFNGLDYIVRLYSTKPEVDVSKIAEDYGGGGHKQAAGFQTLKLPYFLKTPHIHKTFKE